MDKVELKSLLEYDIDAAKRFMDNYSVMRYVYAKVLESCHTKTLRNTSFRELLDSTTRQLENKLGIKLNYFHKYSESFSHEIAMHIYTLATHPKLADDNPSVLLQTSYKTLSKRLKINLQQEYSAKKSQVFNDLGIDKKYIPPLLLNNAPKYWEYRRKIDQLAMLRKKSDKHMLSHAFSIFRHSNTIFYSDNYLDGITFKNFLEILEDYTSLYKSETLEAEEEAFLLEQLYYGISYSSLMYNFAQTNIFAKTPSFKREDYFPLNLYTRIFDTHYPSLTEYVLGKYNLGERSYFNIHDDTDIQLDMYICHSKYQSFYIPLIYHTMLLILYELCGKDYNRLRWKISEEVKKHIQLSKFTYRKRLLFYTKAFFYDPEKNALESGNREVNDIAFLKRRHNFYITNKSGTAEYNTSKLLSKMYFLNSPPWLFHYINYQFKEFGPKEITVNLAENFWSLKDGYNNKLLQMSMSI